MRRQSAAFYPGGVHDEFMHSRSGDPPPGHFEIHGVGVRELPEMRIHDAAGTSDRILATSFSATWRFDKTPENYRRSGDEILSAMLKIFAQNLSPSAQTTLFQMGEAALATCPEISQVELTMPNKHCLLINLAPFGLENKNEVLVPTDEPFGLIDATVAR